MHSGHAIASTGGIGIIKPKDVRALLVFSRLDGSVLVPNDAMEMQADFA